MNLSKTGYAEVKLTVIQKALSRHKTLLAVAKRWVDSPEALRKAQEFFFEREAGYFAKRHSCPQYYWERYCKKHNLSPSRQMRLRKEYLGPTPERFKDVLYWCIWGGMGEQWGDIPQELKWLADASGSDKVLLNPRACRFVNTFKEKPYYECH